MGEVEVFEKEDARRRFPRRPKHAMDPWVATRVHDIRSNWKAQKSYETMNDRQKKVIVHSYVKLPVQAKTGENTGVADL